MCSIVFRVIGAALSIISLFPAVGNSQSRENGTFQGICSVASISKEKGVQGIKAAKPLNQELFYSVSGNRDSIEVDWWGRKVIYNRKEAEGTFSSPNSAPSDNAATRLFSPSPAATLTSASSLVAFSRSEAATLAAFSSSET